jgi:integrase
MPKHLTDLAVRHAKPRRHKGVPTRTEIPDGGCKGLYLITQPGGGKSWAVRYRIHGKPAKLTLGKVYIASPGEPDPPNALTLAAARSAAAAALHKLKQGIDPAAERKTAKPAAPETFAAVATDCLTREAKRLRSAGRTLHDLQRLAFPELGMQPIAGIKRSAVIRLLDKIEDRHGPAAADAILTAIRKVMNWHAVRCDDFASPLRRGMHRSNAKERERDRILTDPELQAVWKAANATDDGMMFGVFVQFLLLSGCRRSEAAGMRWSELDNEGNWLLPKERNKTKVDLVRPLSSAAQAVLARMPRTGDAEFVLATMDGQLLVNRFARAKRDFDQRCGVSGWRLHDLRRTARSLMSRAGVNADIAERCLGHVIAGVRGVYDRHQFHDEMLHAYEALAALIERIVDAQESIVVR